MTYRVACVSSMNQPRLRARKPQLGRLLVGTMACNYFRQVAVVSWYPPGKRDANGPEVDGLVKRLLAAAARFGLELCLHLEPWEGRTAAAQLKDVAYAVRDVRRPRGLPQDRRQVRVLRLRLVPARRARLARGADRGERRRVPHRAGAGGEARRRLRRRPGRLRRGLRPPFSRATGFTQASTPSSWKGLVARASAKGGLFVPCVAPGYDDLRVRPWNGANSRGREAGAYYDRSWRAALESGAARVAVTSLQRVARGHADRNRGGGVHAGAAGRHYVPGVPVAGVLPDEDGGLGGEDVRGGGGGARGAACAWSSRPTRIVASEPSWRKKI